MDLDVIFREKIKPELNFLYTEKPDFRNGGEDWGWYCREHAYHSYFVSKMLGKNATIVCGDCSLQGSNDRMILTSFEDSEDHAWLNVEGICPVDLSVHLEHFDFDGPDTPFIYDSGESGPLFVTYEMSTADDSIVVPDGMHHLRYFGMSEVSESPESLLNDPFIFLMRPPQGGLSVRFGQDIFDQISYHLYRVAIGEIGPYHTYVKPQTRAFDRIRDKNPDGAQKVRELIGL